MAVVITNDGAVLKIVTESQTKYINKEGMNIFVEGDNVILTDNEGTEYTFLYTNVSTPSETSALNLANTIQGYLDTGGAANSITNPTTDPVNVKELNGATSAVSFVTGSTSSTTILAANTARIKAVISNKNAAIAYIKEGTGATASDYTYKLNQDDSVIIDDYTGIISGFWSTTNGYLTTTETTL